MKKFNIALDGPVGSGKTTVGKLLAKKLDYNFLDSGLLYRHFALFYQGLLNGQSAFSQSAINNFPEIDKVISWWQESFTSDQEKFMVKLEKERDLLSSSEVSNLASQFSPNPKLRKIILDFQRKLTIQKGWVVVGRDITSEVLPKAEIKIFLTADLATRVKRRLQQHQEKLSHYEVEESLKERDKRDKNRDTSPLKKTADSWELDTTYLSPQQIIEKMLSHINIEIHEEKTAKKIN